MYSINNLSANDIKFLQFLAIKNEERLSRILGEITKDEPKEIKQLYKGELKRSKLLSSKLRINLYA